MKFIPKTNNQYQCNELGEIYSMKQKRLLKSYQDKNKESYCIKFEHGRRTISKEQVINIYNSLDMELKPIPNCSRYGITINGYIYSYITNCEIQMFTDKDGYFRTSLVCDDGIRRKFRRCRLVALTYINNTHNKPFVNHIDGNKQNDNINNLEWVTASENTQHAFDTGLIKRKGMK